MFNDAEKEELKQIVNKYVEKGHCSRPIHPDDVMQQVNRFKLTEDCVQEAESIEGVSTPPSLNFTGAPLPSANPRD